MLNGDSPDWSWVAPENIWIFTKKCARLKILIMPGNAQIKNLKQFINNFNYPDPVWDGLPTGFPNCDT